MKGDFNSEAFFDPSARIVTIPAHRVLEVDWWSVRNDASGGKLNDHTTADIEREYGTLHDVPAQAYAFVSWDKVPGDMPDETKKLLKQALEEDDRRRPDALKGRVVVSHALRFKNGR